MHNFLNSRSNSGSVAESFCFFLHQVPGRDHLAEGHFGCSADSLSDGSLDLEICSIELSNRLLKVVRM